MLLSGGRAELIVKWRMKNILSLDSALKCVTDTPFWWTSYRTWLSCPYVLVTEPADRHIEQCSYTKHIFLHLQCDQAVQSTRNWNGLVPHQNRLWHTCYCSAYRSWPKIRRTLPFRWFIWRCWKLVAWQTKQKCLAEGTWRHVLSDTPRATDGRVQGSRTMLWDINVVTHATAACVSHLL